MNRTCNRYAALLKTVSLSLVVLLFSACGAAPTREDKSAFRLLQEGKVQPKSTQAFADCLLDGFDKAHSMLSNNTSRQQRRSDAYRVDSLAGGRILIVSADIFDDGRVQLHEGTSAALINTTGERDAFQKCLSQYGI